MASPTDKSLPTHLKRWFLKSQGYSLWVFFLVYLPFLLLGHRVSSKSGAAGLSMRDASCFGAKEIAATSLERKSCLKRGIGHSGIYRNSCLTKCSPVSEVLLQQNLS